MDQRSGELRKKGRKIKLREQPFQVLAMLLERPGQVVTREELQQRLWPEGTFVDYEQFFEDDDEGDDEDDFQGNGKQGERV